MARIPEPMDKMEAWQGLKSCLIDPFIVERRVMLAGISVKQVIYIYIYMYVYICPCTIVRCGIDMRTTLAALETFNESVGGDGSGLTKSFTFQSFCHKVVDVSNSVGFCTDT